jgi:hypothetical protein
MPDIFDQQQLGQPPVPPTADAPQTANEAVDDPNVPLPPGLQPLRLSEQDAETLRRLLDDPQQPTHAGHEMPTADASVLRKPKR